MRQSVQGTMRNTSKELPRALALSRSFPASPDLVAAPEKPNILSASLPTRGAAHAASAPSKHLRSAIVLHPPILDALKSCPVDKQSCVTLARRHAGPRSSNESEKYCNVKISGNVLLSYGIC
jgi:hypothetical protein